MGKTKTKKNPIRIRPAFISADLQGPPILYGQNRTVGEQSAHKADRVLGDPALPLPREDTVPPDILYGSSSSSLSLALS